MNNTIMKNPIILVVDDQPSAREVLRGLLTNEGYDLAFAATGQEGLNTAEAIEPDLILLDVMMPDMDGFEVCQHLRANIALAEVPIIIITALDDQKSRLLGIEAGADDFISKPFNGVELKTRVRSVTRLNRYRRLLLERTYRQQAESEVHRRNQELTLLNRVITMAATTFNTEDALYVACQSLAQAFDVSQVTALLLNNTRTQFTTIVDYKTPTLPGDHVTPPPHIPEDDIPLVGLLPEHLLESKVALVITAGQLSDPALSSVYQLMHRHNLGTLLIAPIPVGDQTVGFIELKATDEYTLDQQDLTLAQSVAVTIGQTIETISLYENLQRHADTLEETVTRRTKELQVERNRIQAILESLGEAVVVTDEGGSIQYLNQAAIDLSGYTAEEAIGQSWQLWQSSKTPDGKNNSTEQLFQEISTTVRLNQKWTGEVYNKRKDGTPYAALLTVAPLFQAGNQGQISGMVSVQSDITALKEAEHIRAIHQDQANQAALDRLRHTFISTVNHEMRTPLSLVYQGIDMLEDGYLGQLTPEQLDALIAIRRQSHTLGQMVEGLIRVAAFLGKQGPVRPVWGVLEPVLNNVLPVVEFQARSKEITIETDISPNLPPLSIDVKQMEEALTQLADNAIKFNKTGGTVKVSAYADDNSVYLAVSDTGKGIEGDLINKIWEMFEQGNDPLLRAQEGLGLGLVLTHYIVEAHYGTIEVETSPGHGSTFTIKLPRLKDG